MKSHESDLLKVAVCIYRDAAAKCAVNDPEDRDLKTIESRVEREGISFLTLTLPTVGSEFEKALSQGRIVPGSFRSFKKRLKVPAFLQGFFAQVFDMETGGILDEPSIAAIESIRQLSYTFKKVKLACTRKRVQAALDGFVQIEQDLREALDPGDVSYFADVSRCIWENVFAHRNANYGDFCELRPKHGPGATAEKRSGNRKYSAEKWHNRLEPYFPLLSNMLPIGAYESNELKHVSVIDGADEQPVRVIAVPKTLKGPRIIAIEPVCMQYTQQALKEWLYSTLQSINPTKGHINFEWQSVNRRLALEASKTLNWATIDLSSASDRVPLSLAMRMFDSVPDIQGAIFACRSRRAAMPDGQVITLRKFAAMGSALCFPIESMYFYTLCIAALLRERNLPVTYNSVIQAGKDVYIYGDDIIVPTGETAAVISTLQKYYCKVNVQKSFWTGRFRESCGMDAYDGEEVTPTYIRNMPPNGRLDSSALISWVETSNLFYKRGYWRTAEHLMQRCERYLGILPVVGPRCAGLGKVSFQPQVSIERWNTQYQCPEIRTWVANIKYRTDILYGYHALSKSLLELEGPPSLTRDKRHLLRSARSGDVTLKRRWTTPY